MARHFNHMGITVSDIDQSVEFYCGVLGLPRPPDAHVFCAGGPALSRVVGASGARLRVAFVSLGGGILELLEYKQPATGSQSSSLQNWDVGSAHLAINVVGLQEFYEAKKDVVEFLSEPQLVEGGPWPGALVVYLRDPDGIPVELVDAEPRIADQSERR